MLIKTNGPDQNKRTEWIKRIARFEEAGLPVAKFCRNERVSQACFYYWAKQVRKIDAGSRSESRQSSNLAETFVVEPERQCIEVFVTDSVRLRMPATNMATVAVLIGLLTRSNLISRTASPQSRFQLLEITDRATQCDDASRTSWRRRFQCLSLMSIFNVYLYCLAVDIRKCFDGLLPIVQTEFRRDVSDGELYVFLNRRADRIKAIWWNS